MSPDSKLFFNPETSKRLMLIIPFCMAGIGGYILDSSYGYLYKIFLFFLLVFGFNGLIMIGFSNRYLNYLSR